MKKTFTKKTLVAGIAAALMTLTATNVNAKETFLSSTYKCNFLGADNKQ